MISRAALTWLRSLDTNRKEYLEYLELKDRLDSLEGLILKGYRESLPKQPVPNFLPWEG